MIPQNLKSATARLGEKPEANCWGLTAFLLGWRSRFYFMNGRIMESRLRNRLRQIKKPKRFRVGDVVGKWENGWDGYLTHTAVYVGLGKWLHQCGYRGEVRMDTFKAMVRSYPGRTLYYRL